MMDTRHELIMSLCDEDWEEHLAEYGIKPVAPDKLWDILDDYVELRCNKLAVWVKFVMAPDTQSVDIRINGGLHLDLYAKGPREKSVYYRGSASRLVTHRETLERLLEQHPKLATVAGRKRLSRAVAGLLRSLT